MADLNPKSLVANGAIVNAANPLPCTSAVAVVSPGANVSINPVTLIVDGAPVSTANPLPISLA